MYTIGQVANITKLSVPTLRYYDEQGLLANIKRNEQGNRVFDDSDLEALNLIDCLKRTGLTIKEIRDFIILCKKGNDSLHERLDFFLMQEKTINEKINQLKKSLSLIKFKEWYYQTAIEHGDEAYVANMNEADIPDVQKRNYIKGHTK
ncbi:MAG: MerR family transcriptional regulator [Bacilli bacterium]